jgi:negative regulator of replication initiation
MIGAQDYIDRLLVDKYANLKADNVSDVKHISQSRYWEITNGYAQQQMAMVHAKDVKNKLREIQQKFNSKLASNPNMAARPV